MWKTMHKARPNEPNSGLSLETLAELEAEPAWMPRAGRRNTREKFTAGLRGLKYAVRGDSSFFAHAYRGTFIALAAAMLRVDPLGWCLLVIAACLLGTDFIEWMYS